MIPELGHFVLWLALSVGLLLGVLPMVGAARGRDDWMALARPLSLLMFALVSVSFACLAWSFVYNDFSVLYVASHSNSGLPLMYRIAGVWGGHEGSLLLWAMMPVSYTHLVRMAVDKGRSVRPDIEVGVCGEHGGDPASVEFFYKTGLDYVSCSPYRVPIARLAAAQASLKYGKVAETV